MEGSRESHDEEEQLTREPQKIDAAKEQQMRSLIERQAAYAESGPEFDPKGKYLCGECAYFDGTKGCGAVEGSISGTTGSCRIWTVDGTEVKPLRHKLEKTEADYAERPEAKGFGCSRCEYERPANKPDGQRTIWCSFWGLRVTPLACCAEEDGPDLVEPSGSKEQE